MTKSSSYTRKTNSLFCDSAVSTQDTKEMQLNETYNYEVITSGTETTLNDISTGEIETTPNEVYGVCNDGIETMPNEVYGMRGTIL